MLGDDSKVLVHVTSKTDQFGAVFPLFLKYLVK